MEWPWGTIVNGPALALNQIGPYYPAPTLWIGAKYSVSTQQRWSRTRILLLLPVPSVPPTSFATLQFQLQSIQAKTAQLQVWQTPNINYPGNPGEPQNTDFYNIPSGNLITTLPLGSTPLGLVQVPLQMPLVYTQIVGGTYLAIGLSADQEVAGGYPTSTDETWTITGQPAMFCS